jgi:hypothetical protein
VLSDEVLDQNQHAKAEERDSCQALRPLARRLAQAAAEPQPDLRKQEGLRADEDHGNNERQMEKSDREPHRELVDADADAKADESEAAATTESCDLLALGLIVLAKDVEAETDQRRSGNVFAGVSDRGAKTTADKQADHRHRHLERRQKQTDLQPLAFREPLQAERSRNGEGVEPEGQDKQNQLQHRDRPYGVQPYDRIGNGGGRIRTSVG